MTKMREEEVRPGASAVAAAGATTPVPAARPTATGTGQVSGSTTLDSAQPSDYSKNNKVLLLRSIQW